MMMAIVMDGDSDDDGDDGCGAADPLHGCMSADLTDMARVEMVAKVREARPEIGAVPAYVYYILGNT